jgi:hypothetical protein
MQMVTDTDGRRRRHNATERRAVLERLAASGLSASAFCGAESISLATLRRWQAQAGSARVPRAAAPRGFLDLGALGGGALTIEVDLGGGVVLRVRRG